MGSMAGSQRTHLIIVIGAGPAGMAVANLLSKAPPEDRAVIRTALSNKFGKDLATTLKLGGRFTA